MPFEWDIIETENKDKVNTLGMKPSELGDNTTYKNIYYWLTSILFIFVPLAFLIVFNSFLIRSVHLSRKERAHMTNTQTAKSKKKEAKKRKAESKAKGKQEFVCKLQLDANNNDKHDNPTTSNRLEVNSSNLQSASDSNLQIMSQPNGQQQASSQSANNLQPAPAATAASKSLLTQRRLSDNPSTESRRTSASSPTAAIKSGSSMAASSNRIEQQSAKQENKITIMLISVVILFLVCQLPVAINLIYTSVRNIPEETAEWYIVYTFNNFLNLMVAINAAGNFVLYCLLSQKYRKTMIALFCPCFKGKRLRKSTAQQATIYSTLTTTNQYHHSPSSTTGFQADKPVNRASASGDLRRPNECRANNKIKSTEREDLKPDEDASKQTEARAQLSGD